ncbi:MAG: lysophospholipase [Cyclobacteriaceae bacterium]
MTEHTEYFEIVTRDGLTLQGKKTSPQFAEGKEPTALLCLVHGFGEHQERYTHVSEALIEEGIIVYTMDLRGHGKSDGKRGHAKRYSYLIDDVEELLIYAREEYNDTPLFLMGHSFGGHIVADFLLRKTTGEIKAAILSSPWLKLAFEPPAFKVKLARLMTKIYPAYSDTSEMDVSKLSRDPEVVASYENDPLVLNTITAGLFTSILNASKWIIDNASQLKVPTLLYHGTADEIISIEGSRAFSKNATANLTYRELEGVYHEPHNDLGKEKVLKMIRDWIADHL